MNKNSIKEEVERGIEKICEIFKKSPYYFYSENDIHCHFFNHLIQNTSLRNEINSKSGVKATLLHKEFPTWRRYRFDEKKNRYLNENEVQGKQRCVPAHYDIAILDEDEINRIENWDYFKDSEKRSIKPFLAVEFGLYADKDHIKKDFVKLSDKENGIEYGYLVHLLRDINLKNSRLNGLKKFIKSIASENNKITVRCLIVFTKVLRSGRKILEKIEGDNYLVQFKNGRWDYEPGGLEYELRKNSHFEL